MSNERRSRISPLETEKSDDEKAERRKRRLYEIEIDSSNRDNEEREPGRLSIREGIEDQQSTEGVESASKEETDESREEEKLFKEVRKRLNTKFESMIEDTGFGIAKKMQMNEVLKSKSESEDLLEKLFAQAMYDKFSISLKLPSDVSRHDAERMGLLDDEKQAQVREYVLNAFNDYYERFIDRDLKTSVRELFEEASREGEEKLTKKKGELLIAMEKRRKEKRSMDIDNDFEEALIETVCQKMMEEIKEK